MQRLAELRQQFMARAGASPLWQRWRQLQPRERVAVSALGLFLLLALFYLLFWQPAAQGAKDARAHYLQQRDLYLYLQANAEQARQLPGKTQASLPPEQLQGLVTSTAQERGLLIERFDSGSEGLQISLPQASFALLLRWIGELQAQGVQLVEVSLTRGAPGKVDARLTLKAG